MRVDLEGRWLVPGSDGVGLGGDRAHIGDGAVEGGLGCCVLCAEKSVHYA